MTIDNEYEYVDCIIGCKHLREPSLLGAYRVVLAGRKRWEWISRWVQGGINPMSVQQNSDGGLRLISNRASKPYSGYQGPEIDAIKNNWFSR